jgi:hypothetical protein
MPTMTLLLIEEILDSLAVVAVVTSAIYWWKASHASHAAVDSGSALRARLNAKAASHAAIAATLQALAVLTHVFELGNWF